MNTSLFDSFFLGGFECSTHRRPDGRRLDLLHATRHDQLAAQDYQLLQRHGIRTARDGLRWHLIEAAPGRYDFSSAIPMLRAARDTRMQVIWDLWHYGWPDHLDIFSAAFVDGFVAFAREAVKHISDHADQPLISRTVNELSPGSLNTAYRKFGDLGEAAGEMLRRAPEDYIEASHPTHRLFGTAW